MKNCAAKVRVNAGRLAQQSTDAAMLCFAQLQLEVAKRIVTVVRKVAPKHNQSCEKFLYCAELQLDI